MTTTRTDTSTTALYAAQLRTQTSGGHVAGILTPSDVAPIHEIAKQTKKDRQDLEDATDVLLDLAASIGLDTAEIFALNMKIDAVLRERQQAAYAAVRKITRK